MFTDNNDNGGNPAAMEHHRLRTDVSAAYPAGISVITSGKGGTGKSTVSVGLGSVLARLGKKVLLMDGDAGLRTLDIMLGLENDIVYDLSDIFEGRCEPIRAIYPSPLYPGLSLIASPSELSKMCAPKDMRRLCTGLSKFFDYVIVDCPAGLGTGFECAAAAAQRALVVSTGDPVCARDAGIVSRMLESGKLPAKLVVNRLRPDLVMRGALPDIDEIMDAAGLPLMGVIPDDDGLAVAINSGYAIPLKCKAGICFDNIARRFTGQAVPLAALEKM